MITVTAARITNTSNNMTTSLIIRAGERKHPATKTQLSSNQTETVNNDSNRSSNSSINNNNSIIIIIINNNNNKYINKPAYRDVPPFPVAASLIAVLFGKSQVHKIKVNKEESTITIKQRQQQQSKQQ